MSEDREEELKRLEKELFLQEANIIALKRLKAELKKQRENNEHSG